jgi:hypothetical protein
MWYADPSGATEVSELIYADLKVRPGNNALRPGIAAVTARLENGTLKVLQGRCPNLLSEAGLYRYGTETHEGKGETPVDDHNHALAALRYLISCLDERHMARPRRPEPALSVNAEEIPSARRPPSWWLRLTDETIWTRVI